MYRCTEACSQVALGTSRRALVRGVGLALGDDSIQRIASIPTPLSLLAAEPLGSTVEWGQD